jgi:hypothetical protein
MAEPGVNFGITWAVALWSGKVLGIPRRPAFIEAYLFATLAWTSY